MPKSLIIGLGNPLMGDDGVGVHVCRSLRSDPRLPKDAEIIEEGGTDLLRHLDRMMGCHRVILIDALLDPSCPGKVIIVENGLSNFKNSGGGAHQLSAVQAIELFRAIHTEAKKTQITFALICIEKAVQGGNVSAGIKAALPDISNLIINKLIT